ncbi:MAG: NAD/NADP octopine/nopaline dehydrogenase family protein [Betaproteobacteria bacterium]|nr:NAD/NADP octopine/nopaline dehydrogenase family protein [Betaproteobacteria bacterium]
MKSIERVAILGAGNGGCAAAVDLTLRGFDVRLWGRSPSTTAPLQTRGSIDYDGILGEGFAPLRVITNDAAEAMKDADAVLIMAPAQAHESITALVAPHLAPGQIFFAAPGQTLTLLPNTLRRHGHPHPVTCVSSTLPYICRKIAPDRVKISRVSARLRFTAFPGKRTGELAERMRPLFPAIFPVPTLLDTLFPYTNAIHHPPAFLCNIGRIESTGGDYCHYYDGITPSVGALIDRLDDERRSIAAAYDCKVEKLSEHFFQMGYTDEKGREGGTAYDVFHNSEPNRWIKAPSSIDHRFFNEDIPFGLVPFSELARLAGLATPVTDAVITLAGVITGKPYRETGLNLRKMGVEGMNAREVRRLVEEGY